MQLRVIVVGKLKPPALVAFEADYIQRARRHQAFEVIEVRDMAALRKRKGPTHIVMDERGKSLDSVALAEWIGGFRDRGTAQLDFLIGDADGFSQTDRDAAAGVFSLSRLTLAHRIARLVLAEQLYRAGTILAGHPYHHA